MKNNKSNAKERLLNHAAEIFALKGYHQATTREICKASEINITAIHYYFNDKAGLYRAVIAEAFDELPKPEINTPELLNCNSIHDAMIKFYTVLLRPFLANFESKNPPFSRFNFIHNIFLFIIVNSIKKKVFFDFIAKNEKISKMINQF